MKQKQLGWIALPIMILIVSIGSTMLAQQWMVAKQHQWQHYYQAKDNNAFWQQVWLQLQQHSSTLTTSPCQSFCAPWSDGVTWQTMMVEQRPLYIKTQHIHHLGISVTRWCATINHHTLHCWWRRDGQLSTAILRH